MNAASGPLPRRRFLAGLGAGAGLGALAACSGPGLALAPVPSAGPDLSRRERVVNFANWLDYLDATPAGRHLTLAEFTRATGIKVSYSTPITENFQFLGQIGPQLALGEDTGYDLAVVSDWLIPQMVEEGWVEPLSPDVVTNAGRLLPAYRDWPVPDVRRYSLPWQGGLTGIGYNLRQTRRPITSMTELLAAPDLRGKVSLNMDMSDVTGMVMLDMGIDPAGFTEKEFGAAIARLRRAVQIGQIRAVVNYNGPLLVKGTIAAGVTWAGDYLFSLAENPHLGFTWPQSGGMSWTDNMVIPALARHKENAERLINFYYRPAIAAQLAAWVQYTCPVLGAQEAMRRVGPALAGEKYIFPSPQFLATGHHFRILPPDLSRRYTAAYQNAVGL